MRPNRRLDDARLDAAIHDAQLRHVGVVEPDEPTPYSHWAFTKTFAHEASKDFTPAERRAIRAHLGLGPFKHQEAPAHDAGAEADT